MESEGRGLREQTDDEIDQRTPDADSPLHRHPCHVDEQADEKEVHDAHEERVHRGFDLGHAAS